MDSSLAARKGRARRSLEGRSAGDAFGDRLCFSSRDFGYLISNRELPGWAFPDLELGHG